MNQRHPKTAAKNTITDAHTNGQPPEVAYQREVQT